MNKLNLAARFLLMVSFLSLTVSVYAKEGSCEAAESHGRWSHHHKSPDGEKYMWRKLDKLNLSQQQHDQISKILDSEKKAKQEKISTLHDNRMAMHKLLMLGEYDAAQVRELANQQAQTQADLMVMHIDTAHKIYMVLTSEQQQKFKETGRKFHHHEQYGENQYYESHRNI